jgi:hypothetical protein
VSVAWGVELSVDGETGAVAEVRSRGGLCRIELVFYRQAVFLADALAELYEAEEDAEGVFVDPMPCAGVLAALHQRMWVHKLEAVDVAAASAQFRIAVRMREVQAAPHPALEQALTYAAQRPLAKAFGYERRNVGADMSPLNAAAFALWGLRRNDVGPDSEAWTW